MPLATRISHHQRSALQTLTTIALIGSLVVTRHSPVYAHTPPRTVAAVSDAEILGVYIQVNGFDVETALLGQAQAASPAVRNLASQVAHDHLGVRQTAFDIAATCKIAPTLPIARNADAMEHDSAIAKLLRLSGREFDKAYIAQEVGFHRTAINAVKDVLEPAAKCPALKAHFQTIVPAFEHHLSQTEGLARTLGAR